jgi:excisionase family DNA binding protein
MATKVMERGSLLNTKEAAEFLRVSEASIRRWSDSGLLPAQRVGRRRERRFAQSDLVQFLGQPSGEPRAAAAEAPMVNVGGVAVPLRTHLAPMYSTDEGRLRLSVPFLADGIRARQPTWLYATGEILERYAEALARNHGVDMAAAVDSGRLVVGDGPGSNPAEAVASWERLYGKALAAGPTVLRLIGEMTSVRQIFGSEAEMMEYEEAYELMAKRYPVVTLCQYDAREFHGEVMLQVLKSHPDMFERNMGPFLN